MLRPRGSPFRRSGSVTLRSTVAQGMSVGSWNTNDSPGRAALGRPPASSHSIEPVDAPPRPEISLSSVLLPQP
jgi:hypothetical protein